MEIKNEGFGDYLNNNRNQLINEIISIGLSKYIDSHPIKFNTRHKKEAGEFIYSILTMGSNYFMLRKSILRNSFLKGCLELTKNQPIEFLIIGFGTKRGTGTDIYSVLYLKGDEASISVPQDVIELIISMVSIPGNEVIIFHNHPKNQLNKILKNKPWASFADRKTILNTRLFSPFLIIQSYLGWGEIKFFLGENGKVREISRPLLKEIF
jgi:hypothetical protein